MKALASFLCVGVLLVVAGCDREKPSAPDPQTKTPAGADVIITDDAGRVVTYSTLSAPRCWVLVAGKDGNAVWKPIRESDDKITVTDQGWLVNPRVSYQPESAIFGLTVVSDSKGRMLFLPGLFPKNPTSVLVAEKGGGPTLKEVQVSDSPADGTEAGWLDKPHVFTPPANEDKSGETASGG